MMPETTQHEKIKKVCVVTTTRADWGLLMPLARALQTDDDIQLSIVASNMHLLDRKSTRLNSSHWS